MPAKRSKKTSVPPPDNPTGASRAAQGEGKLRKGERFATIPVLTGEKATGEMRLCLRTLASAILISHRQKPAKLWSRKPHASDETYERRSVANSAVSATLSLDKRTMLASGIVRRCSKTGSFRCTCRAFVDDRSGRSDPNPCQLNYELQKLVWQSCRSPPVSTWPCDIEPSNFIDQRRCA